ncbi:TRAP transporter substrate-binding protein [Variovorax sp. J22P168]|uniref:TRAP transporter substrate-binding protein n=1 Tax=Variovorax jilinensis TaxID=3053513 RepID=UPI002577F9B1|nr:TRAP transporter substrate-binding protein [Variovorax sp. J22P168]MDM0014605.1 TRAP transporter substrate-binding protein [Variovorax sp. J22P168]
MKLRSVITLVALAAACACASAQVQERTIRFGHVVQPGHPIAVGTQKFAEIVAAKSGGKIKVQELGGGSVGGEQQQLSAVQGGVQDITLPSATVMGGVVKEFTLLDIPFSFSKASDVDTVLAGPFGQQLMARLPEKGLVGLAFWETGFRNFTNSKKPIVNVEDLKGLKLRVIPNPMFIESFAALGTNPVPMPFPELYGALESKAMDAQENPFSVVLTSKFNEVQKYLSVTNHVYTANPVVISKKVWDKLSPDEQKILQEAAVEAGAYERKFSRDAAAIARKELETKGMLINDVPPATLAKMRELTKPVADKFAATYDPAVVKTYRAEMEKIQAR